MSMLDWFFLPSAWLANKLENGSEGAYIWYQIFCVIQLGIVLVGAIGCLWYLL